MAEVIDIEFIPVSVPYTRTEVSALVTRRGVADVLIKATDKHGQVGWGESASGANVESVLETLKASHHVSLTLPNLVDGSQQYAQIMEDDILTAPLPTASSPNWGVPEGPGISVQ